VISGRIALESPENFDYKPAACDGPTNPVQRSLPPIRLEIR
jgi:hypothetical protein